MTGLVVFGAGGHAKVVAASLRRGGLGDILGFIDDHKPSRAGEAFGGATVLGGRQALDALQAGGARAIVLAFGDNRARLALAGELARQGWQFPAVVDPTACVAADASLGPGCYIGAGAIVEPGVRIGAHSIVNTGTLVCHDSHIGAGVHLCPRTCLGGHVHIGDLAWIGIGSVLKDRVSVGAGVLLGAGALVVKDIPAGMLAYGHPARALRKVDA